MNRKIVLEDWTLKQYLIEDSGWKNKKAPWNFWESHETKQVDIYIATHIYFIFIITALSSALFNSILYSFLSYQNLQPFCFYFFPPEKRFWFLMHANMNFCMKMQVIKIWIYLHLICLTEIKLVLFFQATKYILVEALAHLICHSWQGLHISSSLPLALALLQWCASSITLLLHQKRAQKCVFSKFIIFYDFIFWLWSLLQFKYNHLGFHSYWSFTKMAYLEINNQAGAVNRIKK